ncbi:cGMP-dependent protein kinase 1-like isoform X2 [Denticeps clupeoides]|uniref:cGMP-dependent protein kinase 1-like isoform X2 n=1 Tax=Denticeps clupeoides TaxID=299321 RepID=UPI0010A34E9A|nr:cGMP-dependent protein kinase 1-like isoform X2 [Denticeps clupeoides]
MKQRGNRSAFPAFSCDDEADNPQTQREGRCVGFTSAEVMGTLRDLQYALQLKIEELRQRDTLIDELELELDAKDDLIRRLQGELDRLRVTLSASGSSAGRYALHNSSQRLKRRAIRTEPIDHEQKHFSRIALTSHRKSPESQELIKTALLENGFTKHLERGQILAMVDCMQPTTVSQGSCVIQEGDKASLAFVAEEGKMEVSKAGQRLYAIGPGKLFGDLALLHSHTWTTTVKALMNIRLWAIDRQSFRAIMLKSGLLRISQSLELLRSVPFLRSLSEERLIKASEALEESQFGDGDYIIRHGCPGDAFFIVSQGQVRVTERPSVAEEPVCLSTLGRGDWFGERALQGEDMRTVSVSAVGSVTCLVLQRESQESSRLTSGASLSDFQVICTLGEGQFSSVELVHLKGDVSRLFALKIVPKHSAISSGQQGRLQNERKIMMESDSPFIVRLCCTFRDTKFVYMIMEVCLGGELWTLLRDSGALDESSARFFSACVVEALSYLHSRGIIHRDVRPENVHLDHHGYAKLMGFGCAKVVACGKRTWTFCGSPGYMAPEIILNKGHSAAVDFWALGVFIHELLSGSPPFSGSDQMKTYTAILQGLDASEFPKSITKIPGNLIRKLCRKNPSERLGNLRNGVKDVQRHRWFEGFDWEAFRKQALSSPVTPCVRHFLDYSKSTSHAADHKNSTNELSDWDKDF